MYRTSFRATTVATLLSLALLLVPASAAAASTILSPAAGAHVEWFQVNPIVAFDPGPGETPKWVLLASDAGMTETVRYCRSFVGVTLDGGTHWGCKAWAIGANAYGQEVLKALEANRTYYAQVVSVDAEKVEHKSAVSAFAIDNMPGADQDPSAIAAKIWDETVGDGTKLNLGAAAFTNSALRPNKLSSERHRRNSFRITVKFTGGVDLTRSYIKVKSKAGTRYLRLNSVNGSTARTLWVRSAAERKLSTQKYSYQAFLRSAKNGAMVRTEQRVILVRTKSKARRTTIPAWTAF